MALTLQTEQHNPKILLLLGATGVKTLALMVGKHPMPVLLPCMCWWCSVLGLCVMYLLKSRISRAKSGKVVVQRWWWSAKILFGWGPH